MNGRVTGVDLFVYCVALGFGLPFLGWGAGLAVMIFNWVAW